MTLMLLAGIASGALAAAIAGFAGWGWGWVLGFYILGGDIGLIATGILLTRRRPDRVEEEY